MKSAEDILSEALGNNFYWAPNSREDRDGVPGVKELMKVQEQWRTPPKKAEKVVPQVEEAPPEENYMERVHFLRHAIAKVHMIDPDLMIKQSRERTVSFARHHLCWALLRYFPRISLSYIGDIIGRHHSTIINSRDMFESKKDQYEPEIRKIDEAMGFTQKTPGTCGVASAKI